MVWEVATGKQIASLAGNTDPVQGVAFSPDGTSFGDGREGRTNPSLECAQTK